MNAYEKIGIGDVHVFGSHTFTAESIKRFARKYDPQVFHVEEVGAGETSFGRLCASGWHTASAMMRLLVNHFEAEEAKARAAGEPTQIEYVSSFVDGAGSRSVLAEMWPQVAPLIDDALVATIEETAAAVRLLAERVRVIAEGAGALAVAAALAGRAGAGKIVAVVSGGNLDFATLARILNGETPT